MRDTTNIPRVESTEEMPNTVSNNDELSESSDDLVSRILDHYHWSTNNSSNDGIPADSFTARIGNPRGDRVKQQNFVDNKRSELDGLIKRNIWIVCSVYDTSADPS